MAIPDLCPAARAFLDGALLLQGALSDAEADVLVAFLVAEADLPHLQRLADTDDKRVAKRARRGLHLLATRGHDVTTREPRARPPGPYRG